MEPQRFGKPVPDPCQSESRIRICIIVKRWIRILILKAGSSLVPWRLVLEPWRLTMEAMKFTVEPWRFFTLKVSDSRFLKEPDTHQSDRSDPDLH
jgi:hypothetical protein